MKRINKESLIFGIILLVALIVRIWGVNYDLPYIYHSDEPTYVAIIQNIFKTGDLNPHFFNYPSLFFYINAFAYIPYFLLGKLLGFFTSRSDILLPLTLTMGVTKTAMPATILLSRIISVFFGAGAVGLTFVIGKQLTGKGMVGLLASLMLAVSLTNVSQSRIITPDTFVVFFATLSFLAIVFVYQQGQTRHYIIAGICIGLTASSKYNGGLIVLPLLLAHFLRYGKTALTERKIYLALVMCGLGFLAATPFALIDSSKFLADLRFESVHYSTGHLGMEGNTLNWYLDYMWQTANIIYCFSVLEILRGIYLRSKEIILLSTFPVVYFAFISSFVVRNDRTFLPLTPFLFLLAASFMVHLLSKATGSQPRILKQVSISVLACLFITSIIMLTSKTIMDTIRLTTVDSRVTARIWIKKKLPPGVHIAIEPYSPFVEPTRFFVLGVGMMIDHEPEWYIENGFDYLVFSQGLYGRFYREPDKYGKEVALYNNFFNRFELVKRFDDNGFEILIYRVK
jgi:4-amino-4-deoxy-L-arabinose transferase-like glycosyltransferase